MSAKSASEGINNHIALVIKTGDAVLGYKAVLKGLRVGEIQSIVIADNCPAIRRSEIEYYGMLSGAQSIIYSGNSTTLGTVCGRFHNVSCIGIKQFGESDAAVFGIEKK